MSGEYLILQDLWLPHRNKLFQIDYGLVLNNTFFLYELKNYKGEFFYEKDKLYLTSGKEIDDPLTQLARADSLLHQLLQELDLHIPSSQHLFSFILNSHCLKLQESPTLFYQVN
ncbi:nuclease-related domain-containing protein [Gracilibacillus sp. D59]|uniref:nuclease-related domain-containing protein n=1 Tax=Gracilibacillus sp. D59 TaxID=3457434 RepID=UPI003FCD5B80